MVVMIVVVVVKENESIGNCRNSGYCSNDCGSAKHFGISGGCSYNKSGVERWW